MRALVIEDSARDAEKLRAYLERHGHDVTLLATARGAIPDRLVGRLLDGKAVTLDPSTFDFAFVDGFLGEQSRYGWELIPALVEAGVTCIACSSEDSFNDRMVSAGAAFSIDKEELRRWDSTELPMPPLEVRQFTHIGWKADGVTNNAELSVKMIELKAYQGAKPGNEHFALRANPALYPPRSKRI